MLVGMIADISRIRINDKVVFYLQASGSTPGSFYGVFRISSNPFFDENDANNYLLNQTQKGLSFRVLLEADEVYAKGITEHEYLDSLAGKNHPYDLCWSLIYRKLKGNRGCTMITDYEFNDFYQKVRAKNNGTELNGTNFSFNSITNEIQLSQNQNLYQGRMNNIDILPRLLFKSGRGNAFETHMQAYLTKNFDSPLLSPLLIPFQNIPCWIGNEVSCGVGMQRIDLLLIQENGNDVAIRIIELKDEVPSSDIAIHQIPWYLEWLSFYVIPNYSGKNIRVIPTIIAKGQLNHTVLTSYQNFTYNIPSVNVDQMQYIGFTTTQNGINFTRYL